MIECEFEQEDFVVIYMPFYETINDEILVDSPPGCCSIIWEQENGSEGGIYITQKSRSELSTLDFSCLGVAPLERRLMILFLQPHLMKTNKMQIEFSDCPRRVQL